MAHSVYEPRLPWYWRLIASDEPLRFGAPSLFQELRNRNWEIWIYTTSHRSIGSIRRWLGGHGVWVSGIVNQDVHERGLKSTLRDFRPSKNPAAFGISLHVDDSKGVRMEGDIHGFDVVVIDPYDSHWAAKVLQAAGDLRCGSR
jgi:hypothetical protein